MDRNKKGDKQEISKMQASRWLTYTVMADGGAGDTRQTRQTQMPVNKKKFKV